MAVVSGELQSLGEGADVPAEFWIPKWLKKARWKVKIREKEMREPPHVTIIRGTDSWRINLRTGQFMESIPDPGDIPRELLTFIYETSFWKGLRLAWDAKYPSNPINDHTSDEVEE